MRIKEAHGSVEADLHETVNAAQKQSFNEPRITAVAT